MKLTAIIPKDDYDEAVKLAEQVNGNLLQLAKYLEGVRHAQRTADHGEIVAICNEVHDAFRQSTGVLYHLRRDR